MTIFSRDLLISRTTVPRVLSCYRRYSHMAQNKVSDGSKRTRNYSESSFFLSRFARSPISKCLPWRASSASSRLRSDQ